MDRCKRTIRRRGKGEQGFSLVEILIAIAVLIVGIVAVIEMFPPGFEAMNAAETRTLTQAMAADAITRNSASLSQINLIYSRADYLEDNTAWSNTWPAVSSTNPYTTAGPNTELVISGETAPIPKLNTSVTTTENTFALLTTLGTGASTYGLTFSPIYYNASNPASIDGPTIRGENWTVLSGSYYSVALGGADVPPPGQFDPTDALTPNQPQCEVDFTNGRIALPLEYCYSAYNTGIRQGSSPAVPTASYTQIFSITVTTTNASTKASSTYTGTLTVAPTDVTYCPDLNFSGGVYTPNGNTIDSTFHSLWFDPAAPGANSSVNWSASGAPAAPWSSVTLRRDYQMVTEATTGSTFGNDPFQYSLDGNIFSTTQVNSGVIHFNPWAATLRDAQNNPVTFTADYKMADTHILCEDHAATADSIRVDAPSILQLGDPIDAGDGGGTYAGLINPLLNMGTMTAPLPPQSVDVFMYDMDTGVFLVGGTDYFPNYSAGRISLSTTYARTNAHLRVFYCARHMWSASVTKAAASYRVYPDINTSSSNGVYSSGINYNAEYPPDLGYYWLAAATGSTRLYFPYTDIGKTISVGTIVATAAGGSSTRTITGAGNWIILTPDSSMTGIKMGYVDFGAGRTPDGNPPGLLNAGEYLAEQSAGVGPATNVNCASVNVRITYMQNNTWRHQDVTSFVNSGT